MQGATASNPRFRTDLVAEPIDEDGQRFIDVIDPDTGSAFRFYEVEYSIACAMDGARNLSGLVDWAREELGITPSAGELETVIATLGDLGYLAGAGFEAELAPGVVAPTYGEPDVAAPDIELGAGGVSSGWSAPVAAPLPSAGDVELGMAGGGAPRSAPAAVALDAGLGPAGASPGGDQPMVSAQDAMEPSPTLRPSSRPSMEGYDDGPTNLPEPSAGDFDDDEVSVDLSEHLAIHPSDVKEAVRASQVMKAVDVPPELLAQLGDREAQIAATAEAARQAARAREAQAAPPRTTPVAPMQAQQPPAEAARPAVELPRGPVPVGTSRPVARPEQLAGHASTPAAEDRGGTSPVLIVLLVLVVLGAAAFLVWKYVLDKPASPGAGPATGTTGSATPGATPGSATPGSGRPGTPPGPARPSGTAHLTPGASVDVKAKDAGVVAETAAAGTAVKAGDPLVRMAGSARVEQRLKQIDYDVGDRYPNIIKRDKELADDARTKGNEALAKKYDADAAHRQDEIETNTAEKVKLSDGLTVVAPQAGTVKSAAAEGAQVAAGDVLATIAQAPTLSAVIDAPGRPLAIGSDVEVAAAATPDQKVDCKVTAVDGSRVTVTCPADSGWADGTAVVLP
jgi:biotin carboxyl carrier protein